MADDSSGASGLFGGGMGVIVGLLSRGAAQDAENKQTAALQQMLNRVEKDMDPSTVNAKALQGDIDRAKARLNLQQQIDPQLYAQRQLSEQILTGQLGQIGKSSSDQLAAQAAAEGAAVAPGSVEAKNALIDAALSDIRAGATLPPDVQAELMQAGLQQTGAVTGAATARGAGGSILSQVLGTAGIQLKQQRQQNAASLLTTASNLEAQRSQILQGLFPRLQQQQMANIAGTSGILQQSNQMLPEAGLSGSDIANIWLARTGALNQLTGQMGNVLAQGALAKQAAVNYAIGSAGKSLDAGANMAMSAFGGFGGMLGGGGGGGGGGRGSSRPGVAGDYGGELGI